MDEHQIVATWDLFRDFIQEKHREQAATRFVDFLLDTDVSLDVLQSITGVDTHLDNAIKFVSDDMESYDDDTYYSDSDDYDDEDEDM